MYDYIKGKIHELTPTYVVVETNGIGYLVNISVFSYSGLKLGQEAILYVHQVIREDAHLFYGFITKQEREIFRLLLSVSGVGASTARVILSSLSPDEVTSAIGNANYKELQNVKGIGEKTAQRIVVELRDKINKYATKGSIIMPTPSTEVDQAISALIMLGFSKAVVEKAVHKIHSQENELNVEELIKGALKIL